MGLSLDPREAFAELARAGGERIALDRAALLIAAEEYPGLEIDAYTARLDALADGARSRLAGAFAPEEQAQRLIGFLAGEKHFAGNREHYADPRNSFLNDVIDRRRGIPISLAVVYMEVGRRLGLPIRGVGFPAHFLVKHECGSGDVIIDPFFARLLTRDECEERLRAVTHADVLLRPELHLRAARPSEILVRMLGNLKQIYVRSQDWGRALGCSERILLLAPQAPLELRDRGLLYEKLECFAAAAADFERFLELAPEDASAAAVRGRLEVMQGRRRMLLH